MSFCTTHSSFFRWLSSVFGIEHIGKLTLGLQNCFCFITTPNIHVWLAVFPKHTFLFFFNPSSESLRLQAHPYADRVVVGNLQIRSWILAVNIYIFNLSKTVKLENCLCLQLEFKAGLQILFSTVKCTSYQAQKLLREVNAKKQGRRWSLARALVPAGSRDMNQQSIKNVIMWGILDSWSCSEALSVWLNEMKLALWGWHETDFTGDNKQNRRFLSPTEEAWSGQRKHLTGHNIYTCTRWHSPRQQEYRLCRPYNIFLNFRTDKFYRNFGQSNKQLSKAECLVQRISCRENWRGNCPAIATRKP